MVDQEDVDDDFFGNGDSDDNNSEFKQQEEQGLQLHSYETLSKEKEMETIAYLEAFDAHKETQIQDGFEKGFEETWDTAIRIGAILGRQAVVEAVAEEKQLEQNVMVVARKIRQFMIQFDEKYNMNNNNKKKEQQQQTGSAEISADNNNTIATENPVDDDNDAARRDLEQLERELETLLQTWENNSEES